MIQSVVHALYAIRAPKTERGGLIAPISREVGLLIHNLLLALAAVMAVGTMGL